MSTSEQKWDRHSIKAEIGRRGMTLSAIALKAGLYKSACRQGLMGTSRAGAEAIAAALDIPFRTLFPDSYIRGRYDEERRNSNARCGEEQKARGLPDKAQRAA